jgi:large subunit ribosomal protein L4
MIELPIYDKTGTQVDTLAIDEAALGGEIRPALLKQAYVMFHSNLRQGSARTKGRGEISGSTRKLYRQKGTGNARAGARRTGIRKGGGVIFAKSKKREAFRQDMPKKMRRLANRNALLAKLVDNEVKCVDTYDLQAPKTSAFRTLLDALNIDRTCLVAVGNTDRNAALSARNIDTVDTIRIAQLNAFELLNHRYLVVDRKSLESFLDGSAWDGGGGEKRSKRAKQEAA